MTKDLTVGSPMKLIWQFSIPLVLGNLFQQMYNMVDTVIVGRYLGLDALTLSLIHISEPTRRTPISYAVFCLKKKKTTSPRDGLRPRMPSYTSKKSKG